MDDFNVSSLTDSRNEYCALFINKVTPYVIQGIVSIFNEAVELCARNDEDEKYLMTFQNFLSRVTRWNQEIINTETERISEGCGCSYLEDLLTCVHITQLKILTCVRVGQKPKKIDIKIPNLSEFIHKVYIDVARRVYKNVFLFELNVLPLTKQKNMREIELIVRESILDVVRNNMPVEEILRAYVDETTEEDVCETREEVKEVIEEIPVEIEETPIVEETIASESIDIPTNSMESNTSKTDNIHLNIDDLDLETPSVPQNTPLNSIENEVSKEIENLQGLKFTDNDTEKSYNVESVSSEVGSTNEHIVNAPKDIETLEQLSEIRNEQRKMEDEYDDEDDNFGSPIRIHDTSITLDNIDVHSLDTKKKLNDEPLLGEITILS